MLASATIALGTFSSARSERWEQMPIVNSEFGQGSGVFSLVEAGEDAFETLIRGRKIGDSAWYGRAHTHRGASPRGIPKIEVNYGEHHVAVIHWNAATAARERAAASLWNFLPGTRFEPGRSYVLSVDVDTGARVEAKQWRLRGFSIAVHFGVSEDNRGTVFVNSLDPAADLRVEDLPGTTHRLSLHFQTDTRPPAGDLGVLITAAPAERDASASWIERYVLRRVSLAKSKVTEETEAGRFGITAGGLEPYKTFSQLPFRPQRELVKLAVAPVPVVPEPSVVGLILSALPLGLLRWRHHGQRARPLDP